MAHVDRRWIERGMFAYLRDFQSSYQYVQYIHTFFKFNERQSQEYTQKSSPKQLNEGIRKD